MADYKFNFTKGYDSTGAEDPALGSGGAPGGSLSTLTDNQGGTTFTTSDTDMDDVGGTLFFSPPGGTYLGSFVQNLDGQDITFVVVQSNAAGGETWVFGNLPASINLSGAQVNDLLPDNLPALDTSALTVCFAAGTGIATPEGETAVEALQIGDTIRTAEGGTTKVLWVGRQTVHKIFTPEERFVPVRVKAGALGDGLPHTDLVLTADHALVVDGLAINASALVNGTSIVWEPMDSLPEQVTYYHVETEAHEVILANGAPAESYIDYVGRRAFNNYAEYVELYGEDRTIAEMPLPRVSAARHLPPSIRARLAERTSKRRSVA